MAIKANIVIDQGTDFSAIIDVSDSEGTAYDLIGYTGAAQMRKNSQSSSAHDFTVTLGASQIELTMTSSTTNDIEPGRYLYDVEITSSAGDVTRVVEGIVNVTPGITRATNG